MLSRNYFLIFLSILILSCSRNESLMPRFKLLNTEQSGVSFLNQLTESDSINAYKYLYMYNGAGVGIADFNNDGYIDIFFPIGCWQDDLPSNGGSNDAAIKSGMLFYCSNDLGVYRDCSSEVFGEEFIDTSKEGGKG